jgi:hypothetical protein
VGSLLARWNVGMILVVHAFERCLVIWTSLLKKKTISSIKKTDLSWEMAIRVSKAFGSTPDGWMKLQFQYDAAQADKRAKKIKVKTFKGELQPAYQ